MKVVEQSTPYKTARPEGAPRRVVRGVVLHHTGGSSMVLPHAQGSWNWLIDRDGTTYAPVPPGDVAWHCASTDRWTPDWVVRGCDWAGASAINSCSLGIELVSPADGRGFTDAQYAAFRELASTLAPDLHYVGHGEVQADRRRDEPRDWDWQRAGFGPHDARNGRRFIGAGKGEAVVADSIERAILHAVEASGYPASEVPDLIRAASGWRANASSLSSWIEELGALQEVVRQRDAQVALLEGRVAELEAQVAGAGYDPTRRDREAEA